MTTVLSPLSERNLENLKFEKAQLEQQLSGLIGAWRLVAAPPDEVQAERAALEAEIGDKAAEIAKLEAEARELHREEMERTALARDAFRKRRERATAATPELAARWVAARNEYLLQRSKIFSALLKASKSYWRAKRVSAEAESAFEAAADRVVPHDQPWVSFPSELQNLLKTSQKHAGLIEPLSQNEREKALELAHDLREGGVRFGDFAKGPGDLMGRVPSDEDK